MRPTCVLGILCILFSDASAQTKEKEGKSKSKEPTVKIEPRADELLKKMSQHIAAMQKMTFHVEAARELVTEDGLKIQFHNSSDVAMQRPDKLRAEFKLGEAEAMFLYDGKNYTVHRKGGTYFAQAPAPATVDEALDVAREKLEIDAPTADLLFTDPYKVLTEAVQDGAYLGTDNIDGTACHHLIFRQDNVDWQIWVQDGDKPVPCKLVITSKKMKGEPQFEARFSKWDGAPTLTADTFVFKPPEGSIQVSFMEVKSAKTKSTAKAKGDKGDVR